MNLLKVFNSIISRIKQNSNKLLGIKEIGEYKKQINQLYDDMEVLGDSNFIDQIIYSQGIANTAREYNRLNTYYRDYYKKIIKALKESPNTSNSTKELANRAEKDWDRTFKFAINYLYKAKQKALYGVLNEDVIFFSSIDFLDGFFLARN